MRYLYFLLASLAALLLRVSGGASPPVGRHVRPDPAPSASGPAPSTEIPPPVGRPDRPRPYAPEREPEPASEPRIPDRDAFYELAELSRHASRWHFTYDRAASKAPYTATNCVEPRVSVAASSVQGLEHLLDDIRLPNPVRRYYRLAHQHRPTADQERADLDLLARAAR
ncbi:hypothetical protein [Nocardiopsis rhodophaea]|uniref:hypothetical protein n=1 Tax=Nocardiopsis rhodophaea TaxID=280238 RepID=UPI0031D8B708